MTETKDDLPILTLPSLKAWEEWLTREGPSASGAWLKFAKKGAAEATLSKQDAIDGALCHGWIDGQIGRLDAHHWLIRFTPRRPRGLWSKRNRERAEELMSAGRVTPAGVREIEAAQEDGRWAAAYTSQGKAEVPADLAAALEAEPNAKRFFATLTGANRYAVLHRVHTARTEKTRAARVEKFVAMLARGETIHPVKGKAEN
ncbi:YdeI/OmpD-associated family protein [Aquabacter sp. CN5-332]|uniref:YdeI/OmpD-associated family protein n=1 Tax=Aquabacter sp. CN5-332 TaxID=3156608 RepID=UPI0032B31CD7